MKLFYQKIYEYACPYLRTRKNLIHTKISLKYALKLLRHEKGDEAIVIPAIILHDIGWSAIPEHLHLTAFGLNSSNFNLKLNRVHEKEGAKIAKRILEEFHYPPKKVKEICEIIQGHDSRKRPISQNDRVVKDADKLFRYSRRGLTLLLDWFPDSRETTLNFLEEHIEKWFFLLTSRQLAGEELARRRRG